MQLVLTLFAAAALLSAQSKTIDLSPAKLQARNVKVEAVTFKGRAATRLTDSSTPGTADGQRMALLPDLEFTDGIIEFDFAGDRVPGAAESARGFTGLAFRVAGEPARYNAFYLRPYNGRSKDQVQRNHSVQYISMPEFPWRRLREEFPKMYESYVDLVPGEWTKVKIEVRGNTAKLYVHGAEQPTLVVNDLKGGNAKGSLALWIDPSSLSHFANLRVTP
jgi:hypothetical protein